MWKSNFLKWVYKLNATLNTTRAGNFRFVRSLKRRGKKLLLKMIAPDNLLLIKVDDMPLHIRADTESFNVYGLRPYEPYTTELFKQAINAGARVLDIGAQFGYFSLLAAKRVGAKGKVYAFEPAPTNFELLKRNIEMAGCNNVIHAVQKAVGDKQSAATMFLYEDSDSHSLYRHPQAAVKGTVQVECITIDVFLAPKPVDVIKMDIEGNEPYALEGMKQTILKSDSLILFTELAPAYLRRAGVTPEDYLAQLNSLGFDVQLIDEDLRCLKPVIKDVLQEDNPSWYANLYCTKRQSRRKL